MNEPMPAEQVEACRVHILRELSYGEPGRLGADESLAMIAGYQKLLAEVERLDAQLVNCLTLSPWDEVETELVEAYSSEISTYDGVKAVYGRIQDMLVNELIAARIAAKDGS